MPLKAPDANPLMLTKSRLLAEAISIAFMALIVAAANGFGLFYILFPEMGALASDVLLRPGGKWAREPWKLIATPSLTAALGIAVGAYLPYGVLTILLTMVLSIGVVFGLRSAVAPAISAGVLPIVLGVHSWLYPACILGSLLVLAGILNLWKGTTFGKSLLPNLGFDEKAVDILESSPKGRWWFPSLFCFVLVMGSLAQVTTWHFILFPPLIVMAYEMLGHTETCPWAKAPLSFPVVCTLAAFLGVEADLWLGVTPAAAALALVGGFALLYAFRLRMPPALAIGLIPFVVAKPSLAYPISVAIGTVCLTLWFVAHRAAIKLFHQHQDMNPV